MSALALTRYVPIDQDASIFNGVQQALDVGVVEADKANGVLPAQSSD